MVRSEVAAYCRALNIGTRPRVRVLVAAIVAATLAVGSFLVPIAGAASPTSVSHVSVAETGPTDAAGALSEFTFSFTTSPSGGMSQAEGSEWWANFPSGTGVAGNGTVTDTTTDTVVGGVGNCTATELCGTFYGGVTVNPGDSLSVDATSRPFRPPAAATPSRSTPPRTPPRPPRPTASAWSRSRPSPTCRWPRPARPTAAGALSEFTFSFKTSSTGGMSQRDSGEWWANFPSGTGVAGNGTVTDTTTDTVVGGVGNCTATELCGTFYGGVTINPGDSLSVDATSQTLPAAGSGYTISVHTSSDTTPTTSSNSFSVVPVQAVSNVSVAETGADRRGRCALRVHLQLQDVLDRRLSRRTRASGGPNFPSGTGVTGNGTVTDTATGTVVGGVGACSPTELCGTFYGGVTINPGDSLSVTPTARRSRRG